MVLGPYTVNFFIELISASCVLLLNSFGFLQFLMVLRKKNDQITFLHVYHHTLTFGLWWIGVKWTAGGSAWFSAFQNSFVHFWMYGYYFLSVFGYQYVICSFAFRHSQRTCTSERTFERDFVLFSVELCIIDTDISFSRNRPWWKKYLTQMQILQFFLNCAHAIYIIKIDCPFPQWMQWGMLIYMASLIVLFMNFYIQAYVRGRRLRANKQAQITKQKKDQ